MELFKNLSVVFAICYVFWFLIRLGKSMLKDFEHYR